LYLDRIKFGRCLKKVTSVVDVTCRGRSYPLLRYQKNAFSGFCQKFPQAMHEVEIFFCQFPNPWTLRVSGMGGYTSKCEKKSKSLHPNGGPWTATIKAWRH
jgi:hypothetical protein